MTWELSSIYPPLKDVTNQLSAEEGLLSEKISKVCIHIERAIQRIKTYHRPLIMEVMTLPWMEQPNRREH